MDQILIYKSIVFRVTLLDKPRIDIVRNFTKIGVESAN
jgi:hypothetical protein